MKFQAALRAGLLLSLAMMSAAAQSAVLKEQQWQAWLDAGKLQELEQAAQARLEAQPADPQASVALALVVMEGGDPARLEPALKTVQTCLERQPAAAICHYALGALQGLQASNASVFKAIGLAGKIKSHLQRALELDPQLYEARVALTQFYLLAPGIAGGSVAKARELAEQAKPQQPEQAKLLRALIAAQGQQWAEMERELLGVRAGEDKSLQGDLREAWYQLGMELVHGKQYAKARGIFEQLQRDYPNQALGGYGLGRLLSATGQPEEAVKQFERVRELQGANRLPLDHRLGQALLDKGDKAQAKVVLERFVANKRSNPRNVEDARKLLAGLS